MKLSKLGILGLISLLSYTTMVVFAPLAYHGYTCFQWVSDAANTDLRILPIYQAAFFQINENL